MSRARRARARVCLNCALNCWTDSSVSDAAGAARFRNPWSIPGFSGRPSRPRSQVLWVLVMLNSRKLTLCQAKGPHTPSPSLQRQHSCDDSRARVHVQQEIAIAGARPEHHPHDNAPAVERQIQALMRTRWRRRTNDRCGSNFPAWRAWRRQARSTPMPARSGTAEPRRAIARLHFDPAAAEP